MPTISQKTGMPQAAHLFPERVEELVVEHLGVPVGEERAVGVVQPAQPELADGVAKLGYLGWRVGGWPRRRRPGR